MLARCNQLFGRELRRRASIETVIAFKARFEIGDRHPDLVHVVVAQRGGQFGAGQRGMGGELDRGRLILQSETFDRKVGRSRRRAKAAR